MSTGLIPPGDRPARELAVELLPHLEVLANLHYLFDWHVESSERLKELRREEDEVFEAMYKLVLHYR